MRWLCWLLGHTWERVKDDREMNLAAGCSVGDVVCRCKRCNAHVHIADAGFWGSAVTKGPYWPEPEPEA